MVYIEKVILGILGIFLLIEIFGQGCSALMPQGQVGNSTQNSQTCRLPAGVSGSPQNIEDVVRMINSLPKPVSLSCFIESLDRPLKLSASQSASSAQPAVSVRSPRFFIASGPLVMTVVPEGKGRDLIELAVLVDSANSIKGEILFPVDSTISPSLPYDRVRLDSIGTNCRFCHAFESRATQITFAEAYVSQVLRPMVFSRVSLADVQNELYACDFYREPFRCKMLKSIMGTGDVVDYDF